MIKIDKIKDYKKLITDKKNFVVKFYSETCPPCNEIKKEADLIAQKYKSDFLTYQVNINLNDDITRFEKIIYIPTFIFYFEGKKLKNLTIEGSNKSAIKIMYGYFFDNYF